MINKKKLFFKIFSMVFLYIIAFIIQIIGFILTKKSSNLNFAILFTFSGTLPFCPLFFIASTFLPKKLLPLKIIIYFLIAFILVCFIVLYVASLNNDFIITSDGGITW